MVVWVIGLPVGSLRYGDYGLRTTAGRALSFVRSTGLSRANIEGYDCTVDYERRVEWETTRKDFLVFIPVHKNANLSLLHVILSLEQ